MKRRESRINKIDINSNNNVEIKSEYRQIINSGLIIFAYFVTTLLLTYPVITNIFTRVAGGSGDTFLWMRVLWYTKYALLNPDITSLSMDMLRFYPNGIEINAFPSAYNQMMYVLLSFFLDNPLIYNILWLSTFIIAGYGTYLLAKYLTHSTMASFLSGIIFAFAPYHMVHGLGHLGAFTIQWIPFFFLFAIKSIKENSLKYYAISALFFSLIGYSDLQYLVFSAPAVALLLFWDYYSLHTYDIKKLIQKTKGWALFLFITIPFIIPITYQDIIRASGSSNPLKPPFNEVVHFSMDLLSFFTPSPYNPFVGNVGKSVSQHFTGGVTEYTAYIGFTVLILSFIGIIGYYKREEVKFWIIMAVSYCIFSLGPFLHILGNYKVLPIPLPYYFLYYFIPFLENSRTVGRFYVFASLAIAILSCYGFCLIIKTLTQKKQLRLLFLISIVIFGGVFFEYCSIPYLTAEVDNFDFYNQLHTDHDYYGILILPSTPMNYAGSLYPLYYQTVHEKPIVGNHVARLNKNSRNFENNTFFIKSLSHPDIPDITRDTLNSSAVSYILDYYNIRYIILHTNKIPEPALKKILPLLNSTMNLHHVENNLLVYAPIPLDKSEILLIQLKEGFDNPVSESSGISRWSSGNTSFEIHSNIKDTINLSFEAKSDQKKREIEIRTQKTNSSLSILPDNYKMYSITIPIRDTVTEVSMNPLEPCDISLDRKSNKNHCLGISYRNVSVSY